MDKKMSLRPDIVQINGIPRRKKEAAVRERNILGDEFMAASIGDVIWLDHSLRAIGGSVSGFDRNGLAPIHLAALHGRLPCLQLLVEKYEVDVDSQSTTGWRPLHLCINKDLGTRALKCLEYLLSKGADANVFNDDDVSPVHQAASEGLLDCLKVLLSGNYTEKLTLVDKRGHTALDLARIWGHRSCARILRTEMWKSEKNENAEEMKQLEIVKQYFGDLQKEAVHQLRNEQQFYGGVAFGNWISDKGLPENLKRLSISHRESYPDLQIQGLLKRLKNSGGLDDCAQRLEKASLRQEEKEKMEKKKLKRKTVTQKPSSSSISSYLTTRTILEKDKKLGGDKVKDSEQKKLRSNPKVSKSVLVTEKSVEKSGQTVKKVKVEQPISTSEGETPITETPYSEMTQHTTPTRKTRWNFSTNLQSEPPTDIKFKTTIALSILPDEQESFLTEKANLPVKLETDARATIKVTVPGGRIKSASIRMPDLPRHIVRKTLSGETSERIRMPQEFRAVHVHDLQKKKVTEKPREEAAMHLSFFGDPRIVRESSSIESSTPKFVVSSDLYDNLPPIKGNSFNRIVGALNAMNSPRAFLA